MRQKRRRFFAGLIAAILALAMVLPLLLSAIV